MAARGGDSYSETQRQVSEIAAIRPPGAFASAVEPAADSSSRIVARLASDLFLWHTKAMDATIVMGRQGRVVIPAEIRGQLGLAPGDHLHLHLDGTRLVIERPEDAVRELRQVAAAISPTRSLVEELLADRRADMKLE